MRLPELRCCVRTIHCGSGGCLPINPPSTPWKPQSLSHVADKCASMRQLQQVHAQMVVSARILDNYAASRLISAAATSYFCNLSYALKVFDHMSEPNSFMWNTVIRALASSSKPAHAISFYARMRKLGVVPRKHTFSFVLKGCTNSHSLSSGTQVHTHVMKFGLEFDLYIANGLIRSYGCCGGISYVRRLFDCTTERNVIVWTTMISCFAHNSYLREALISFDEMITEGINPNSATLSSVLSACSKLGNLELGRRIHEYIIEKKMRLGVILGSALVDMYAKNGAIMEARELFEEMPERNIVTWNAMICGLASHGHAEGAVALFIRLEEELIAPNDVTFVGVLSACSHAGLLDVGCDLFCSMSKTFGIKPKLEHYGCLVDLLGRWGLVKEAENLIMGIEGKADVAVMGALLSACRNSGNVDTAERVVKKIRKLDPHNHSIYVALSNMHADAGRWQEVVNLRMTMRNGHLRKIPASSVINGYG